MLEIPETLGNLMPADIDLRSKIDETTNQVLEAHARAHNLDKSEIVRRWLSERAKHELHVATLITRLTRSEGGRKE